MPQKNPEAFITNLRFRCEHATRLPGSRWFARAGNIPRGLCGGVQVTFTGAANATEDQKRSTKPDLLTLSSDRHTALVEFSSIVSVIALLLSLLSAWYTRHAARAAKAQVDAAKQQAAAAKAQLSLDQDRRNEELARRRKEDEEAARADLRVTLIWVRPHPPQIVVHNHGPHLASDISLSYLDADDGLPPPDTSRWDELAAVLGPERASSVDADLGLNTTRRFRVTLRWNDGMGSRSTVEQLQLH
jgi:hypothetical protein